jgi:hypothetical protein
MKARIDYGIIRVYRYGPLRKRAKTMNFIGRSFPLWPEFFVALDL